MSSWKLFLYIIQVFLMRLDSKLTKDKRLQEQKDEHIKQIKEAIAAKDASRVNLLFDKFRRLG